MDRKFQLVLLSVVALNLISCGDFDVKITKDESPLNFHPSALCQPQQVESGGSSNGPKMTNEQIKEKITALAGKSDKFGQVLALGQKAGDTSSWILAILAALSIGAGTAVASPAVGLLALVFGVVSAYKDNKEKQQFIKDLQDSLTALSHQMELGFINMQEYVDSNTILYEKGVVASEFKQMYSYVSDCMRTDDQPSRRKCLVDRCSYVRAGFHKFAIYYDELSSEFKAVLEDNELPEVPDELEEVQNTIKANYAKYQPKVNWKEKYKKFSPLQVRRIQANMYMFSVYVEGLLLPCEFVRLLDKMISLTGGDNKELDGEINKLIQDEFQDMSAGKTDDFDMKDMVYNYMKNANEIVLQAYQDYNAYNVHSIQHGGYKKGKKDFDVKCRLKMSPLNMDTCDVEFKVDYKHYQNNIKPRYTNDVDGMLRDLCDAKILGKENMWWKDTKQAEKYKDYFGAVEKNMKNSDVWGMKAEELKAKFAKLYTTAVNMKKKLPKDYNIKGNKTVGER